MTDLEAIHKVTITIESTPDGGAYIQCDPSLEELLTAAEQGHGTTAGLYGTVAMTAMLLDAKSAGAEVRAGEAPPLVQ
jgi:hypothetical protein